MKKVILRLDCGVGMSSADAFLVTQEDWDTYQNGKVPLSEDTLGNYAWYAAVEFASGYGIYPMSDMPEGFDEDDDEHAGYGDSYSEDIDGWFEEYDPEEHDGLMVNQKEWKWATI